MGSLGDVLGLVGSTIQGARHGDKYGGGVGGFFDAAQARSQDVQARAELSKGVEHFGADIEAAAQGTPQEQLGNYLQLEGKMRAAGLGEAAVSALITPHYRAAARSLATGAAGQPGASPEDLTRQGTGVYIDPAKAPPMLSNMQLERRQGANQDAQAAAATKRGNYFDTVGPARADAVRAQGNLATQRGADLEQTRPARTAASQGRAESSTASAAKTRSETDDSISENEKAFRREGAKIIREWSTMLPDERADVNGFFKEHYGKPLVGGHYEGTEQPEGPGAAPPAAAQPRGPKAVSPATYNELLKRGHTIDELKRAGVTPAQ